MTTTMLDQIEEVEHQLLLLSPVKKGGKYDVTVTPKRKKGTRSSPFDNGMWFQCMPLSEYLAENVIYQTLLGCVAGLGLYFSTCVLRKTFTAAMFLDETTGEALEWFSSGITLKTALVLSQMAGFMIAKLVAIKIVSEAKGRQDVWLAAVNVLAELTLVVFGALGTAPNWTPVPMFFNGLMVGMVWGLVVLYFEGRQGSDTMLVFLSLSLIVSHGFVKDVGLVTMDWGVDEFWMPAVTGGIFLPMCLGSLLALNQLPPPSEEEVLDKTERINMDHKARTKYFLMFWPGLTCLWIGYVFPTAYRDYRDSFTVEIFAEMKYDVESGMIGRSETIVAAILLVPLAVIVFIKSNVRAFTVTMFCLIFASVLLLGVVYTYMGAGNYIDSYTYYVLTGVASYLAYVPYTSVLFERMVAVLHEPCNLGFLMAIMDALGYIGVFMLFLLAEYSSQNHLQIFNTIGQVFGYTMIVVYGLAAYYFLVVKRNLLQLAKEFENQQTMTQHTPVLLTMSSDEELRDTLRPTRLSRKL
jgi:hypothetical protein